ncbi:hypothetical protein [Tychonema sp. BBK16]|uniref:hypothetical protein n=1 Tax=Tychonema sp. BBK16 TaxID=2699888 RepID=UPI0038D33583
MVSYPRSQKYPAIEIAATQTMSAYADLRSQKYPAIEIAATQTMSAYAIAKIPGD